jgi:hypothetical protein
MEVRGAYLSHDPQPSRRQPPSPVWTKDDTSTLETRQFDAVRSDAIDLSPNLKSTIYRNKSGANCFRSRRQVSHSCAVPGDS